MATVDSAEHSVFLRRKDLIAWVTQPHLDIMLLELYRSKILTEPIEDYTSPLDVRAKNVAMKVSDKVKADPSVFDKYLSVLRSGSHDNHQNMALLLESDVKKLTSPEYELSIQDLPDVCEAMYDTRGKWYKIGLLLRISKGTLDVIEADEKETDKRFIKMIITWLHMETRPTWSALSNVLRDDSIGRAYVADHLREAFQSTQLKDSKSSRLESNKLSIDDIPDIWEFLLDARLKWYEIGIMLRLDICVLDTIKSEQWHGTEFHSGDSSANWDVVVTRVLEVTAGIDKSYLFNKDFIGQESYYFLQMLLEWLECGKNTTMDALLNALRSKLVGRHDIADMLIHQIVYLQSLDQTFGVHHAANTISSNPQLNQKIMMRDALEALYEIRAKWFMIGIMSQIPFSTLECMKKEGKTDDCFRNMLGFLESNMNLTWQTLEMAVRSKIVGRPDIADLLIKTASGNSPSADQTMTEFPGEEKMSISNCSHLSINDIHEVYQAMYSAREIWYQIGILLKIDEETLIVISMDTADSDESLLAMLRVWLYNGRDTTLTFLIDALYNQKDQKDDKSDKTNDAIEKLTRLSFLSTLKSLGKDLCEVTSTSGSDCSCLTSEDMPFIIEAMFDARRKWHEIGTELKINQGVLNVIKIDAKSTDARFIKMLQFWLNNFVDASWNSLAKALGCQPSGHSKISGHEQLSSTDLLMIARTAEGAIPKWYIIGVMLKLDLAILDSIKKHYDDAGSQSINMFYTWLTIAKNRNWTSLVDVFQSKVIGCSDIATAVRGIANLEDQNVAKKTSDEAGRNSNGRKDEAKIDYDGSSIPDYADIPSDNNERKDEVKIDDGDSFIPEYVPIHGDNNEREDEAKIDHDGSSIPYYANIHSEEDYEIYSIEQSRKNYAEIAWKFSLWLSILVLAALFGQVVYKQGDSGFLSYESNYTDLISFNYRGKFFKWTWKEHSLGVTILDAVLPSNIPEIQVQVKAAVWGNFILPENKKPASTFFHFEPDHKFQVKVQIKVGHYAANKSNLSFAISYDKHPPFKFQLMSGGKFFDNFGIIQKESYCWIAILRDDHIDPNYHAIMYSSIKYYNTWTVYLFITEASSTLINRMQKYADSKAMGLIFNCETAFTIDKGVEKLKMNISLTEEENKNGWHIAHKAMTEINIKKSMISTHDNQHPAEAVFKIDQSESSNKQFRHNFILEGTDQNNPLILELPMPGVDRAMHGDYMHEAKKESQEPRYSSYYSCDLKFGTMSLEKPYFGLNMAKVHGSGNNGHNTKIAIIDNCNDGIHTDHKALQKKSSYKVKLEKIHCDGGTNHETNHALICTSIAVGEAYSNATYVHQDKIESVSFPGGIAPKAQATVYLVDIQDGNTIIKALDQVIEGNFDVLSMSFGCDEYDYQVAERLEKLKGKTIMVAAAGNKGDDASISFPARHEAVICVGSLGENSRVSSFTPTKTGVDIYFPGEVMAPVNDATNTTLRFSRGTSVATPGIAGIVSLLVQSANRYGCGNKIKNKANILKLLKQVVFRDGEGYTKNSQFLIDAFTNKKYLNMTC